jgi:hypothetical protein
MIAAEAGDAMRVFADARDHQIDQVSALSSEMPSRYPFHKGCLIYLENQSTRSKYAAR